MSVNSGLHTLGDYPGVGTGRSKLTDETANVLKRFSATVIYVQSGQLHRAFFTLLDAARTAITDRRYAMSTNTAQFTIAKLDRQGAKMRCLILPLTLESLPKLRSYHPFPNSSD